MALQLSAVQALPSSQFNVAAPVQIPNLHESPVVHLLLSEQEPDCKSL
jgi:hypothetical protein